MPAHVDASHPHPPERIGPYRIVGTLGRGGMGCVYRAMHDELGREIALKVLHVRFSGDADFRKRFLREARALGAVSHPNVVTCHDADSDGDHLFLAMEILSGGDLKAMGRRAGGRLAERTALRLIRQAASGLGALHAAGLIHRDLKPENLFLTHEGTVKVADLGLARFSSGDESLTESGTVLGTPAYASPEQASGLASDHRTDIYSLGATLFALLTGRPPFVGDNALEIIGKVQRDPVPDPRSIEPSISPATAKLVLTAMARDPAHRHQNAQAFADAIDGLSGASDAPAHGFSRAVAARRGVRWLLAAGVAVIVFACAWWLLAPSARGDAIAVKHPDAAGSRDGVASTTRPAPAASASPAAALPRRAPAIIYPSDDALTATAAVPNRDPASTQPLSADVVPVTWAVASGSDRHGRWADLEVGATRQRLRWCAPGRFSMGSPPSETGRHDNETGHQVVLSAGFWLADSEVTQELWRAVMGSNPSRSVGAGRPVEQVSWDDCQAFLTALRTRCPGLAARLPSEAEWEYACRGGMSPVAATDDDAWHRGNAAGSIHAVRALEPNAWGLHDLLGNVWEWCEDGYEEYPTGLVIDPLPTVSGRKVKRGGSYRYAAGDCRAAFRDAAISGQRLDTTGMRLAVGQR